MAQNVGPILEMVTEKYLLRSGAEWAGRQQALGILDETLAALREGDIAKIGAIMTRNFREPIQTIIPWASNYYTESLIRSVQTEFREKFWGFWMLGGMSGGGMGFIFDPEIKEQAQRRLSELMSSTKKELAHSLPFAMDPVVYDFTINEQGTVADLLPGSSALMPRHEYTLIAPVLLRQDPRHLAPLRRAALDKFGSACRHNPELGGVVQELFDRLFPRSQQGNSGSSSNLRDLLTQNGFDAEFHRQIRNDLKSGRIGLAQNRLPATSEIEDVRDSDVVDLQSPDAVKQEWVTAGMQALAKGEVAVVTLAAGAASRWTQGAGVVKSLHPFCKIAGRHRTFIETHLAKSRRSGNLAGTPVPHVFTTSHLTHGPISGFLERNGSYGYPGSVLL